MIQDLVYGVYLNCSFCKFQGSREKGSWVSCTETLNQLCSFEPLSASGSTLGFSTGVEGLLFGFRAEGGRPTEADR